MRAQYTFTTFTPSEVERIVGVATATQRDWRRRGFLPTVEGHARFDAFSLAELWVIKLLSDRGIGPQASEKVVNWCAAGIVWGALATVDAYEGDHQHTLEWHPGVFAAIQQNISQAREVVEQAMATEKEGGEFELSVSSGPSWRTQADWLRRQIMRLRGFPRVVPAPFLIWWADGTYIFHASVDAAFKDGLSGDARLAGPVVVLDLAALASTLLDRIGRPLVHVEFPT